MKTLIKLFFPVPYWGAVIWHIILGGTVAALIGYFFLGYSGQGYTTPITGGVIAVLIGAALYWTSQNRLR